MGDRSSGGTQGETKIVDWNTLIDEQALAALLPGNYARFARPVKEGLVVFLSGLPAAIQKSIIAAQATLPATATLSERLGLLAAGCPALHKLAQVLARDHRLAEELRRELRPLESLPPTVDFETIRAVLVKELGPLESRAVRLLGPAIAEASVAVVIPFRDLGSSSPREGVLKVLKPGIEERLELELELLGSVGSHLVEKCAELSIPQLDYRDTFEQVCDKLRWEIRLDQEQRHLLEAAALYKDDREVQIPALLDQCTSRVTAMERVFGVKVTDHGLDRTAAKRRLSEIVSRALVAQPVFSRENCALFHGDPHAGNLLYTQDRRLAILDWSLVGHLSESERIAMGQIILSAVTLNASRIVAVLAELNTQGQVNQSGLRTVVDRWLCRVRYGQFPGLTWLVGMLDEATQSSRLRMGQDIMIFRKSLHTLEGVVRDLGTEDAEIEKMVFVEFLLQFGREWPERWFSSPTSRSFATRLSNMDIAATILGLPLAAARFWQTWWASPASNLRLRES
jgi:ubiquinone biosynthesis protein